MRKDKSEQRWKQKSLESLENNKWPDQKEYLTGLIKRCHEYRKIPLNQLTVGQLRTLIAQKIGLKYLMPIAIEFLSVDILIEGDFYSGDLLESIVKIEQSFWQQNIALEQQLVDLINSNIEKISYLELSFSNLKGINA